MRVGETLDDRFALESIAGTGGMGEVYRARDLVRGHHVAIKTVRAGTRDAAQRLQREMRALAALNCADIVRYLGHGMEASGRPYVVMEWLEGVSLATRLEGSPLALHEGIDLAERLSHALGVAHRAGIVHRDRERSQRAPCVG